MKKIITHYSIWHRIKYFFMGLFAEDMEKTNDKRGY